MKIIERDILPFQEDDYFSAVRDKIQYAKLLVKASRVLLLDNITTNETITCRLKLVVDKMSRLFFSSENKHFSISFPFTVDVEGDDIVKISTYSGKDVDHEIISSVISILDDEQFNLNPSLLGFYMDGTSSEFEGVSMLEEIFQFEPSYIRYDYDPINVNGNIHPLYHIDVNYSTHGTFKIGLKQSITIKTLEDILNTKTDCVFFEGKTEIASKKFKGRRKKSK